MTDNHKILYNTDETSVAITFTAEEETLFARWYENGYNIPDPQYVHWIELNHPEDGLEPLNMDSDLPEERLPATFNTLPSESCDLLPHTGSVSLSTMEGNATMLGLTGNDYVSGTLFTSPSTSGELSITIDSPVPGPPQHLISNSPTVTPGSTNAIS